MHCMMEHDDYLSMDEYKMQDIFSNDKLLVNEQDPTIDVNNSAKVSITEQKIVQNVNETTRSMIRRMTSS
jgi:hypothetical protein